MNAVTMLSEVCKTKTGFMHYSNKHFGIVKVFISA
jgi:hypothetical protein